jgi:rsbT co-antagonist protein RsbR
VSRRCLRTDDTSRGIEIVRRAVNESEHASPGPDEQASILRGLLEAAAHAIVVVDERGEIVLVNPAAEALFAYDREELIGETVEILVPERFRDRHGGQRRRFMSRGLTRRMGMGLDLVACRKDGTEFPAEIGLSRIQTAGGC